MPTTRAKAAREAGLTATLLNDSQVFSPPATPPSDINMKGNNHSDFFPSPSTNPTSQRKKLHEPIDAGPANVSSKRSDIATASEGRLGHIAGDPISEYSTKKRKVSSSWPRNTNLVNGEVVKGGWDELPHNMGNTTKRAKHEDGGTSQILALAATPTEPTKTEAVSPILTGTGRATKRTHGKKTLISTPEISDEMEKDLNANISQLIKLENESTKYVASGDPEIQKPKKVRAKRTKKIGDSPGLQAKVEDILEGTEIILEKKNKGKNSYGITPGETPFPGFMMPSIEACNQVNDLLSEAHGKVEQPATIPPPSLEVTGCGEVPSVLDALIRTRLSAATTGTNSAYAFSGLVAKYGILESGIGQGSVNWNKVRDSSAPDIEQAIKRGGLAKSKSISIKKILDMVYEQNIARRDAFIKERDGGKPADVIGAEKMLQSQKDMEIATAEQNILSLQYMHGLSADEAMAEFTKFPGIGVKTASCVILFCLRRPSFAVDTHVWRLCKWLKWIPEGASRDQAFSHCEVRVPNDLKYSLHQLFIRHGKTCGRCRAATGETSEEWEQTVCPIEHLVIRTGKRKGPKVIKSQTANVLTKKKKKGKGDDDILFDETSESEEPPVDDNDEIDE